MEQWHVTKQKIPTRYNADGKKKKKENISNSIQILKFNSQVFFELTVAVNWLDLRWLPFGEYSVVPEVSS